MHWKLGAYKNAKAQYEAMLKLNPGDNQGNRDELLCLLLEVGEAKALERALNTFRRHTFADGHTEVVAGTIWHYTNACWCYQRWRNAQNTPKRETAKREAERALHEAFTQNRCVPTLLLASEGLPELDELSAYSKGDGTEAAMYVNLALKAWQQIPGALEWLKEMALQAHLFSEQTGRRKGTVPRITIHVVPRQEDERGAGV